MGKLLHFGAAIDVGSSLLAVVAILNSFLYLAVCLRIVVPTYGPPKEVPVNARSSRRAEPTASPERINL